jgi:hypothetical protein
VSPKKGDPVAPPAVGAEWRVRYCTNEAIKGWQDLETRAAENLRKAWEVMRNDPGPGPGKPTTATTNSRAVWPTAHRADTSCPAGRSR